MADKDFKNIKEIGNFVDGVAGSYIKGWGCLATIFVFCVPLIAVLFFVKWLFQNGHLG